MGRVKSEMFEDDLGPDDELVAKPLGFLFGDPLAELTELSERVSRHARIQKEIQDCGLPVGSLERLEYMSKKLKELTSEFKC